MRATPGRRLAFFLYTLILCIPAAAIPVPVPPDFLTFSSAYPDVQFAIAYDAAHSDWHIEVTVPRPSGEPTKARFYWAGGAMLPPEELASREKYWSLLYHYPRTLTTPATLTEAEAARLKSFGSTENRQNGAGTPMFFFDTLYDSHTRGALEKRIVKTTFLGHRTNIHERIVLPLRRVETRIQQLAKSEPEIRSFIAEIQSADAYYWRIISGTNRKSFHSLGIAIDILPKSLHGKEIFWSWAKDKDPENWMLTPLSRRWMPPADVIRIFEEEGFIWGGKWGIFDNMHFEYHPELIQYNFGE